MTVLETFGEFVAQRGELAPDVQNLLRLHAADTVAAWVAAGRTAEARQLFAYRDRFRTDHFGASVDVIINCALARSSEVDDIHIASMITPGSIIVPATLSIAALRPDTDAATLNAAMVAGYEAMIRFGLAINGAVIPGRGIWPTYFAAAFGVAAAASRLFHLDGGQTAHALGFALTQSAPGVGLQNTSTTTRWLAAGNAARNGLQAAYAAASGFTSDLGLFEGRFLSGIFNIEPDISVLTQDLAERVTLREVSFKPWSAARQSIAATQAFKEILATLDAAQIEEIEVKVPPLFLRMLDHGVEEVDRMSRLTSLPYQVAIAALAPEMAFDVGQAGAVPPAVRAFMDKVKVGADESLMKDFPLKWHAEVRVRAGGKWHQRAVADVPGDPSRPFDEAAIREKCRKLSARAIGVETCDALMSDALGVVDGRVAPSNLLARIEAARS